MQEILEQVTRARQQPDGVTRLRYLPALSPYGLFPHAIIPGNADAADGRLASLRCRSSQIRPRFALGKGARARPWALSSAARTTRRYRLHHTRRRVAHALPPARSRPRGAR